MNDTKDRGVQSIKEVPNEIDEEVTAYMVTLDCGHHLIITGNAIFNIKRVNCKTCGGTGKVEYWS